jgi:cardiolipin synthase
MESVFMADWQNATKNTKNTPAIKSPFLVYSPINSEERIVALIQSASKTIDLEVENLGDEEIQKALVTAAQKNVQVRVLVPLCDKNFNPFHNVKYIEDMQKKNIQTRVMPSPATEKMPYMHSKMILVDGQSIYLGSINFSNNSIKKARELGIIFSNQDVANQISDEYKKDWLQAIPLPETRSRIQCIRDMRGTL